MEENNVLLTFDNPFLKEQFIDWLLDGGDDVFNNHQECLDQPCVHMDHTSDNLRISSE